MKVKKKTTPAWVDKFLSFRRRISEDEYRDYWKRLNRVRKDRDAWNAEGHRIIMELEKERKQPVFRSKDYKTVGQAKRAAEIYRSDVGGRVVRRDSKGRFSKRGGVFQVIR
jgi:hypothetical protein